MVTNNNSPCPGLPGSPSSSVTSSVGGAGSGSGSGGLIVNGSTSEGGVSEGASISVATISAASSGNNNNNNPSGPGGPSLLPVGIPFLSGLGPDPSAPFYPAHPGAGFDLKENMEAWRSIPSAYASMYAGYDNAFFTGYPMLRNNYGMDLNGSRRKNATRETTSTLKAWLNDHRKNPYPTKAEKIMLAIITQMSLTQVSTWFANARRRLKKENKMTWSPRNRCDDDDDDCKEGVFNSSTDTRDVDGTPLGSVNHHHRSASSTHSNGAKDLIEPDSDIEIDDSDSSSDNLIEKKRFKRNESPLSDSGGSGITISATSTLGEHHLHQPSFHHPSRIHRGSSVNSLTNLHHNHHHHLPHHNLLYNHHHLLPHPNLHHNHHHHLPHLNNHLHQNNDQPYTGIQNAAILPATTKPRIWSIVDIAISNTTASTNNNNPSTRPVSTSSPETKDNSDNQTREEYKKCKDE